MNSFMFRLWLCFRFAVSKFGNNYYGQFYILVDGARVAIGRDYTPCHVDQQGTATINLYLTAGQQVQVENSGSTYVFGTDSTSFLYSWFTGYLLYAV